MNKKNLHVLIIIILAIIFIGLGIIFGKNSHVFENESPEQTVVNLKQKFNLKVKENLIPFVVMAEGEKTILNGQIDSLQKEAIDVKIKNVYKGGDFFDYLNEPNFYIKTIKISEETEIIRQEMKDSEEFQDEIEEYNKDQTGPSPFPFKEILMSLEELQKDMEVSIGTVLPINLGENETINAQKIVVTIGDDSDDSVTEETENNNENGDDF